jgi:biopolymer transport protein ExbB/biopolymer transport protein TolQ
VLVSRLLKVALLGSEWVMWLLLGLSVISFAFMAERLLYFLQRRGDTDALGDRLASLIESNDTDEAEQLLVESRTIEAQVMLGALHWVKSGAEAFSDAVDSQLGKRKKDLERGLGFLGTLGSNAPFIGLFGTVIGVIGAFTQLSKGASSGAGKAAMDNVIGLIGESLVATGVGLFVAIPAVIGYNLVQARIASIETNVGAMTKQICAILKSTPATRTSSPRELEAAE